MECWHSPESVSLPVKSVTKFKKIRGLLKATSADSLSNAHRPTFWFLGLSVTQDKQNCSKPELPVTEVPQSPFESRAVVVISSPPGAEHTNCKRFLSDAQGILFVLTEAPLFLQAQ